MLLDPIPDARALRLELSPDERGGPLVAIIVAELHVGLETDLSRSGAHIASSTPRLAASLLALAKSAGASRIIVAGDFKQTVPVTTFQERREVPGFIADLVREVELHIVLGNHDAGLRDLVPTHHGVVVHDAAGVRYGGDEKGGGVGVFHGHAWPSEDVIRADELVAAHTHPAVALVDGMGHAHVEPCWVHGPLDTMALIEQYGRAKPGERRATTLTLLPPFNPLLGGAAVNVDGLLGPAGKLLRLDTADLFLLDGTHLGKVSNLPPVPDTWRRGRRAPKDEDL